MTLDANGVMHITSAAVFEPLFSPSRFKGVRGGRGSGKSHFVAERLIDESIEYEVRVVCAREVQNSIKDSVKQLLEDKIQTLGVSHLFTITEKEIRGPNNSLFIFRGLQNHTSASIKSLEGFNRLWCEEAQTISHKSLELAIPTFRKSGAECWFTWNPESARDPVDKLFLDNANDPAFILVEANYTDNPWFPEELRGDMERDKRRDPDKYAHVWLGQYRKNSEARVFHNWVIEEFERPPGTIYRFGLDFGFAVDPSALIRCSVEGNRLYIDYEAVMVGLEIVNMPDWLAQIPESDKWFITADSSRPETISHLRKHGYPKISPSAKGAGSVAEGVEWLKSFDVVVHPRCEAVINELSMYSWKVDPLTNEILPILEDKNNHCIDALRYSCEAIRRAKPVVKPKLYTPPGGGWMG